MSERDFDKLIKPDRYQVFLLTSRASTPIMFAVHPWFVVNKKGDLSRWEILWKENLGGRSWGHLYKDERPPFRGLGMFFWRKRPFWNATVRGVVEGGEGSLAHGVADFILHSPETYPHKNEYSFVGVDSNTYVQWVLDKFPDARMHLPWNAIGKGESKTI